MKPIDYRSLKKTANEVIAAQKQTAGRVAVVFFLLLNALRLLISYLSSVFAPLPPFEDIADMIQYISEGHTDDILKLLAFEVAALLFTTLFSGVFSAYCLKITQGQPANSKTLLGSLETLGRFVLLFLLFVLAVFVLCELLSLLTVLSVAVGMLCSAAMSVLSIVVFYMLRLVLFSVADNKNILSAVKDCFRLTNGHKKELFLLDFSFVWFAILITLIPSLISSLPDALGDLAVTFSNASFQTWVSGHLSFLDLMSAVLGVIAVLPLYYRFYTSIQVTYALVYQKLKDLPAPQEETQPLAYMEFSDSEQA